MTLYHPSHDSTVEQAALKEYNLIHKLSGTEADMKLTSFLYRMARISRDAEVIASGDPKKMARRAKNKLLGRTIVRRLFRW